MESFRKEVTQAMKRNIRQVCPEEVKEVSLGRRNKGIERKV